MQLNQDKFLDDYFHNFDGSMEFIQSLLDILSEYAKADYDYQTEEEVGGYWCFGHKAPEWVRQKLAEKGLAEYVIASEE